MKPGENFIVLEGREQRVVEHIYIAGVRGGNELRFRNGLGVAGVVTRRSLVEIGNGENAANAVVLRLLAAILVRYFSEV